MKGAAPAHGEQFAKSADDARLPLYRIAPFRAGLGTVITRLKRDSVAARDNEASRDS